MLVFLKAIASLIAQNTVLKSLGTAIRVFVKPGEFWVTFPLDRPKKNDYTQIRRARADVSGPQG